MKTRAVASGPFRRDVRQTLMRSRQQFGSLQASRYKTLIEAAITRLTDDPPTPAARPVDATLPGLQVLRLRSIASNVGDPHHLIVFTRDPDQHIVTLHRLLDERSDVGPIIRDIESDDHSDDAER